MKSSKRRDLPIGSKYGMLTVLGPAGMVPNGRRQKTHASFCRCDCGNTKSVKNTLLIRGITISCGCLSGLKHGMSHTKLYKTWRSMNQRCHLVGTIGQKNYMDRNISVCKEWRNGFDKFRDWAMASGYAEGLQIDRINNSGNYEPSNCRWVTRTENLNNKRNNIRFDYHGKTVTLMDAVRAAGRIDDIGAIRARILNGWDGQRAVDTPIRKGRYKEGRAAARLAREFMLRTTTCCAKPTECNNL